MRISRRPAVLAATVTAMLLFQPAGALAATLTAGWHVAYRAASGVAIFDLTAPSRTDAWAFGGTLARPDSTPIFVHWNGHRWRQVTIPGTANFHPTVIESTSPDNVWIFGETARPSSGGIRFRALVFNGTRWSSLSMPVLAPLFTTVVVSRTSVWVAAFTNGCTAVAGASRACSTELEHWNGSTWVRSVVRTDVQALTVGGSHVWLLGESDLTGGSQPVGRPALFRLVGGQWQRFAQPERRIGAFPGIAASSRGDVWLLMPGATKGSPSHLDHWNGRSWTRLPVPATAGGQPLLADSDLAYDGATGVWAGPYAHWTGSRWLNTFQAGTNLGIEAVAQGTRGIWASGYQFGHGTIDFHGRLP